jgi:hypothetical protein
MSGPKAFSLAPIVVVVAASALAANLAERAREDAEQENRRKEQLRKEEEERQAERERLRRIAEARAAAEAAERARVLSAEIAAAVTACEVEIESSGALVGKRFSLKAIEDGLAALKEMAGKAKDSASVRKAADRLQQALREHLDGVRTFREVEAECVDRIKALGKEKSVQAYSAPQLAQLKERHQAILNSPELFKAGPADAIAKLRGVIEDTLAIRTESLTRESTFEVRNKLLSTTIQALKGLGFFVSDPEFANAADPLGNVILTATRGAERVVLSVPLQGDVQSDWQGVAEGPCKDGFFEFLDKLEAGGFPCKPTRPDLQQRPTLIRKGAKSLPGDRGIERNA